MATSGNWLPGKIEGTVITDDGREIDSKTVHAADDFFGGRLICSSVRTQEDVNLLCASKDSHKWLRFMYDKFGHQLEENNKLEILKAIRKADGK
jgi:hypothetical protein